jgi:hypothetical protein
MPSAAELLLEARAEVEEAPVEAPAPAPVGLDASGLIALQRSAGNAAVSTMIQRAALLDAEDVTAVFAQHIEGEPEEDLLGAAPSATAGPSGEPEAAPDQLLQRAIATVGRSRKLLRAATWAAGAVHQTSNLATNFVTRTAPGLTLPALNGTNLTSTAAARGAIARPTLRTVAGGGGFDAEVDTIPGNTGSFDETVLAPGPWTHVTSKATIAGRLRTLTQCSAAGDTTFRALGNPSDAAMFAANRRHEDHHANDHHTQFDATVLAWDTSLTAAKAAGRKFHAGTAPDAEAALWFAMGGTPDQVAENYFSGCVAAGAAFHSTPAGGPISAPSDPHASTDCATSSAKFTNPS